jgi:hypothetical protein
VCGALEAQLWATLPSFCSWAQDTAEAFRCVCVWGGGGGRAYWGDDPFLGFEAPRTVVSIG